ncbi:hypothetical protein AJ80_05693 [Polytolypa hystricis UAMH7299]|uniref:Uncharacterized protein n=1 Tax=Polytolypa hystricis (strain UAMH7299) TaxID=1447883 RepID=A0A2B7Y2N0_POLH7|nr:hypothetical protein AJ80_05693 [Polytolypa hystricis UAMH7299]
MRTISYSVIASLLTLVSLDVAQCRALESVNYPIRPQDYAPRYMRRALPPRDLVQKRQEGTAPAVVVVPVTVVVGPNGETYTLSSDPESQTPSSTPTTPSEAKEPPAQSPSTTTTASPTVQAPIAGNTGTGNEPPVPVVQPTNVETLVPGTPSASESVPSENGGGLGITVGLSIALPTLPPLIPKPTTTETQDGTTPSDGAVGTGSVSPSVSSPEEPTSNENSVSGTPTTATTPIETPSDSPLLPPIGISLGLPKPATGSSEESTQITPTVPILPTGTGVSIPVVTETPSTDSADLTTSDKLIDLPTLSIPVSIGLPGLDSTTLSFPTISVPIVGTGSSDPTATASEPEATPSGTDYSITPSIPIPSLSLTAPTVSLPLPTGSGSLPPLPPTNGTSTTISEDPGVTEPTGTAEPTNTESTATEDPTTIPSGIFPSGTNVIPTGSFLVPTGTATTTGGTVTESATSTEVSSTTASGGQTESGSADTTVSPPTEATTTTTSKAAPLPPVFTDSETIMAVKTSILYEPKPSKPSTTRTPASKQSSAPKIIAPFDGIPRAPDDTALIQIGFNSSLSYEFIMGHTESANQVFAYVPMGVAYGLEIPNERAVPQLIQPLNTLRNREYTVAVILIYIPKPLVSELEMLLHNPNSLLFNNPTQPVRDIMMMIDPSIPLLAGEVSPSPGHDAGQANPTDGGDGGPADENEGEGPGGAGNSSNVNTKSVGIGLGVVCGAAVYGAAMFFVARRYRKRRSMHRRSSSISTGSGSFDSEQHYSDAFMSGARGGSVTPHGAGGRNSRTSGAGSARTQMISAPVMSENSLGWN